MKLQHPTSNIQRGPREMKICGAFQAPRNDRPHPNPLPRGEGFLRALLRCQDKRAEGSRVLPIVTNSNQDLKGTSSHWINEQELLAGKFAWGRGYGAFSVSQSGVKEVCAYIAGQAEHHRAKTFNEEYRQFVKVYGLVWRDEETVETVSSSPARLVPLVKTRGQ
jgi:hypothetical protein